MPSRPPYRTVLIKRSSGERAVLLVGPVGLPVPQACLFLTSQYRNPGCAANTLLKVSGTIGILYEWADRNAIHLHERFARGQFLERWEVEDLVRRLGSSSKEPAPTNVVPIRRKKKSLEGARANLRKPAQGVSLETREVRIRYTLKYLEWLANYQCRGASPIPENLRRESVRIMLDSLKAGIPKNTKVHRSATRLGLTKQDHDRIIGIVHPDSEDNPYPRYLRLRNYLVFRLLETGIRLSELLALKATDFNLQSCTMTVHRRPDDVEDDRVRQPVAKTKARMLPISEDLNSLVREYVMTDRHRVAAKRKHGFLVVSQRKGRYAGQPISATGLRDILGDFNEKYPEYKKIHSPHIWRYTANDRFSEAMDRLGVSPEEEARLRNEIFGWADGSEQGARYSRRHVIRKAGEAFLSMQADLLKGRALHFSRDEAGRLGSEK